MPRRSAMLQYHTVRKVDASTNIVSLFAGTPGTAGYSGDGSAASLATLNTPSGLAIDAAGLLWIADTKVRTPHMIPPPRARVC